MTLKRSKGETLQSPEPVLEHVGLHVKEPFVHNGAQEGEILQPEEHAEGKGIASSALQSKVDV